MPLIASRDYRAARSALRHLNLETVGPAVAVVAQVIANERERVLQVLGCRECYKEGVADDCVTADE